MHTNARGKCYMAAVILCILGQNILGQTLNVTEISRWDDDSLSAMSGLYFNDLWGYVDDQGREYAIIGSVNFTHFIDITDPFNPQEVDREPGNASCLWRDFKTFGTFAYGVADNCGNGLQIYDLSPLPDSVHKVYDSDSILQNVHNLFIDTTRARLYASGLADGSGIDIAVLDLSENEVNGPDNPSLIGSLDLSQGYVHDLYVRNDTAYCSHGNTRSLVIYDFGDLNNISVLGSLTSYQDQGYNHSNWVSQDGNTLVMADENHGLPLKIVDISDLDNIEVISQIKSTLLYPADSTSIPHNPFIVGNSFAVVSYYHDGVQIFKIDSSSQPFLAGYLDTYPSNTDYIGYKGSWGVYPFLPSGLIIASDTENGLFVMKPDFPLWDCEEEIVMTGTYDHYWDVKARQSIQTNAILAKNSSFSFTAGNEITLSQGFQLGESASLELILAPECQN